MSRVQRFQGGVKNGSSRSPSSVAQPLLAARRCPRAARRGRAPGRTRTCAPRPGGWCARSRAGAGPRGARAARAASPSCSSAGITARSSGRPCSAKRAISSSRRSSSQPASSSRKKTSTGAAVASSESKRFLKSVTLGACGLSPDCERVRRLHPDGVPAGLRDVHRVRDPPGRAGRACRCGCTSSSRSRSASRGTTTPCSTRSGRSRSTCRTRRG